MFNAFEVKWFQSFYKARDCDVKLFCSRRSFILFFPEALTLYVPVQCSFDVSIPNLFIQLFAIQQIYSRNSIKFPLFLITF